MPLLNFTKVGQSTVHSLDIHMLLPLCIDSVFDELIEHAGGLGLPVQRPVGVNYLLLVLGRGNVLEGAFSAHSLVIPTSFRGETVLDLLLAYGSELDRRVSLD